MPGTIVHFLVVNKILDKLSDKILVNRGLLYAGSIAPDAVHALPDYVRDDKRISHLRTDIRDAHFHLKESLELFNNRIENFIEKNMTSRDKDYDFYLGYLIHLYTDELFILTVRMAYNNWRSLKGKTKIDKEFYKPFINDVELMDSHILCKLKNKEEIIDELEKIDRPLTILNLDDKSLRISRLWVINNKLKNNVIVDNTEFMTTKQIMGFVEVASETIFNRLYKDHEGLLVY